MKLPRIIYAIQHNVTKRIYVGSSANVENRYWNHMNNLRNHKHNIEDMSKSERGEQARDYFTSVEDKAKEMIVAMREASKDPMKMLKLHYQAVEQVDKKVDHAIGKVDALEERFDKMERDMPVFTIDAKNIQSAVRKRGIEVMGGKDSNAYKDNRVRGSVYSDIQSTLKRNFGVRKYEEIKHQQVDIALDIIAAYEPPYILKEKVNYINSQLNLF